AELLVRFQDLPPTPETRAAEDKAFDDVCARYPNPPVSLADVVRHIEHAAEVMGPDHVGIGFDLDGGGGTFEGLRDVADYPNVTAALLARGWDEARLEKLWGLNSLRLMRAVEAAAG
ncbi:MAG: membrane dipeptidase, partial [Opitutaceae bacterium]